MRPIPLVNYQTHQHDQDQQPLSMHAQHEHTRQANTQYFGIAAFVLLVTAIVVFKVFTSYDQQVENGRFYSDELMSLQLIDFWKMTPEKLKAQQDDQQMKIIETGKPHAISRQELGHRSWSLLHMMTGSFPEQIDQSLRKKFNVFLILFGQMYPCKLCSNHFMELLKKQGLFTGKTKKQLMKYLCQIHNKVNQRLQKPIHDCSQVYEEWNTCGCSGQAQL